MQGAARYYLARAFMTALFGAFLFAAAGRLDWERGWLYLAIVFFAETLSEAVVFMLNPEVLNQRGSLMREGTKPFDRAFVVLWPVVALATAAVAGLDAGRYGWTSLPAETVWFAVVVTALAYAIGTWAMVVNSYFEPTVRIQHERGHRTVTSGPYRFVRHPGYVATILGGLAAPLLLGSAWMFVPTAGIVLLFVVRTALEDATLRRELPGYREYSEETRHRLLPGVW